MEALEAKPRRSVLSRKTALVEAARAGSLPADVTQLVLGATIPGYVASVTQNGVFVRFLGQAVQVDPIKLSLKAPGIKLLKLKHDKPLSNLAVKFNLRRYTWGG